MYAKFASTSAMALTLLLAAPGFAQETAAPEAEDAAETPETTEAPEAAETPDAEDAPDVEDLAETMVGPSITSEELQEMLGEIGIEDREPFPGAAVYARDDDGRSFLFLLAPRDFARDAEGATIPDEHPDFQNRLARAGLPHVQGDIHRVLEQGTFDGHHVLAIGGHDHADAAYIGAEMPPVHADMADFDDEAFRELLAEAGLEDVDDLEAQLFHARADEGRSVYFLVGPEGFAAGESVELEEGDLVQRLEDAGLEDVQAAGDEFRFVRGEFDELSVLVIAGPIDHWGATAD